MNHLTDHIQHHDLKSNNKLYVVGVFSNYMRYHSRYRLARQWIDEMKATPNVELRLVECAFGDRHHELTEASNPNHLQLRTNQEIWHKENMVNLGVRHLLPRDWKYVAWIDGDITFRNPHWAQETMQQLQHYPLVQPWSDCTDLGFRGNILNHFQSFCYVHRLGVKKQRHPGEPYKYAHSGFAWACTRHFWENTQGLLDFSILGSADHHMAWAAIGDVASSVHGKMSQGFKDRCRAWQDAACRVTLGSNVGYVEGRIEHHFHGPKGRRRYRERWQILIDAGYDPNKDLSYDSQGLIHLDGKPKLLAECSDYFKLRHEDSIENY